MPLEELSAVESEVHHLRRDFVETRAELRTEVRDVEKDLQALTKTVGELGGDVRHLSRLLKWWGSIIATVLAAAVVAVVTTVLSRR